MTLASVRLGIIMTLSVVSKNQWVSEPKYYKPQSVIS